MWRQSDDVSARQGRGMPQACLGLARMMQAAHLWVAVPPQLRLNGGGRGYQVEQVEHAAAPLGACRG